MKPPREFWLIRNDEDSAIEVCKKLPPPDGYAMFIHVREVVSSELSEAIEDIRFYADRSKMKYLHLSEESPMHCCEVGTFVSDDWEVTLNNEYTGGFHGKRARDFLAKHESVGET